MDCPLPGSSVHGIFQARILEWVAIAFSSIKNKTKQTRKNPNFCWELRWDTSEENILIGAILKAFEKFSLVQSLSRVRLFATP